MATYRNHILLAVMGIALIAAGIVVARPFHSTDIEASAPVSEGSIARAATTESRSTLSMNGWTETGDGHGSQIGP